MAGNHHRDPAYVQRSRLVRVAANADPTTKCWRCGLTLAEHIPHRDGRRPRWTAGHVTDGDNRGPLLPEASTCNYSAGATAGNQARTIAPDVELVTRARRWRG